jgi:hypothetical protein
LRKQVGFLALAKTRPDAFPISLSSKRCEMILVASLAGSFR